MKNNLKQRYTETISTKLSREQKAAFVSAAELAGMKESEFVRHLIVASLDCSPDMRLFVTAQCVSEAHVRLLFEGAMAGEKFDKPGAKAALESRALATGTELAERRLHTLLHLRFDSENV